MEWSECWHLFLERRQICSVYKGVEIDSSYPLPLPFELLTFVPEATVDPVHGTVPPVLLEFFCEEALYTAASPVSY